ncbi:MAG: FlgD immunoglobulin-like domain containing protein [candidate division WOR-3 bacterium]
MYRAVFAVLVLPALMLAAPNQPVTALPAEIPVQTGPAIGPAAPNRPAQGSTFTIGVVDTIGGTTYDWQANGPALRMLVNSPDYGVHALFMYSASTSGTTFPDRNMRYNFYDYGNRTWNWIDPDFMQSGVNTFTYRTGFGSLDAKPSDGVAVVSAHHATSSLAPVLARDMAPGAGIFEYCPGEPTIDNYAWPYIGVGDQEYYQLAMFDYSTQDDLYYSRSEDFTNWTPAVTIPPPQPQPMFPSHQIAVSKVPGSEKIAITWEFQGGAPDPGFYRLSNDGGVNWENPVDIPWPPAFGGDTATSYHITSIFPMFDAEDQLHIVANVMPYVGGQGYIIPAQLWHWCEANTPNWSHITTATCDPNNLGAAVGYNAMYACRPSMGEDQNGNLFVAWEQFDSINVEPGPPERLRADIFYSHSSDNGQTWAEPVKITDGGTVSHRFPCIMDYITDTVMVMYMIDQRAGFYLYNEGPATYNPIVVQKWANPYGPGIKSGPRQEPRQMAVTASPNPFSRNVRISYAVPRAGTAAIKVYDITGRPVRTLVSGRVEPGRYSMVWDGCDESGRKVAAGVYLYKYSLGRDRITGRLTIAY